MSELLRLERENRRLAWELERAGAQVPRLRRMIQFAADLIILASDKGTILECNEQVTTMVGIPRASLYARPFSDLLSDARSGYRLFGQLRQLAPDEEARMTVEVQTAAGEGKLLDLVGRAVDENGRRQYVLVLRDNAEQRALQADLEEARRQAEMASQAKSAFLAAISHDLRTPMTGILGMIDLLRDGRGPSFDNAADGIREAGQSLLALIDSILDYSKGDAGKLELDPRPFSLAEVAQGVADLLYPVSLREGGELVVFIDPELPFPLLGDGERLRQVLFNLLGNAIKFSSQQTGRRSQVRLEVELVETDGVACKLLLAVTDNGIGISDADQERLFLPFEQAKETGDTRFGGTGLGLSICRQLVQLMGGEIEVFSAVGVGSRFEVQLELPCAPNTDDPTLEHTRAKEHRALAGQGVAIWAPKHGLGRDLRRYLTYYGAHVTMCSSLEEAVDATEPDGERRNLVIVDLGPEARSRGDLFEDLEDASFDTTRGWICVSRGSRFDPGEQVGRLVTIQGDVLRRSTLLAAVMRARDKSPNESVSFSLVDIPILDDSAPRTPAEARQDGSLILVVEDDDLNRRVLLEQLSILGLTAIGVGTAEEGLASWREGGVGLIFTDLRLPRMSGVEMAAQVRTEEVGRSRIEIVGLSALGRDAEPDAGSPHLDRFLTKPVSLRMLERELDRLQIRAASELSDTTLSAPVLGSEPDLPLRPQYLQKIVGDDELVIRGFVLEFKRTQSELAAEIVQALEAGDVQAAGQLAHRMSAASRALGADRLASASGLLDRAGRSRDAELMELGAEPWRAAWQEVADFLRAYEEGQG